MFHRQDVDLPIIQVTPEGALDRARNATAPATIRRREPEQREPWTAHDLRRTAGTVLDNLEVLERTIKAVLNHADDPGVTGIYARGDLMPRMRKALDQLAAHYEAQISPVLALLAALAMAETPRVDANLRAQRASAKQGPRAR